MKRGSIFAKAENEECSLLLFLFLSFQFFLLRLFFSSFFFKEESKRLEPCFWGGGLAQLPNVISINKASPSPFFAFIRVKGQSGGGQVGFSRPRPQCPLPYLSPIPLHLPPTPPPGSRLPRGVGGTRALGALRWAGLGALQACLRCHSNGSWCWATCGLFSTSCAGFGTRS